MTATAEVASFAGRLGACGSGALGAWTAASRGSHAIAPVQAAAVGESARVFVLGFPAARVPPAALRPYQVALQDRDALVRYLQQHPDVSLQLRRLPEGIAKIWPAPLPSLALTLEATEGDAPDSDPDASAGGPVVAILAASGTPVDHAAWLRSLHEWCADHERPTKDGAGYTVVVSRPPRTP